MNIIWYRLPPIDDLFKHKENINIEVQAMMLNKDLFAEMREWFESIGQSIPKIEWRTQKDFYKCCVHVAIGFYLTEETKTLFLLKFGNGYEE